ncbi:hypothetical protein Bca52824_017558 [Brassica carinata]|uniref:Replication factor A C-terminal domain-containing protein n=1 Tax=Brassica carinata TaxID=52824 RepID=A0A8X7VNB9_BRACI|nr:hypothetical protein Bca52824_017558 [Brassica carinata]
MDPTAPSAVVNTAVSSAKPINPNAGEHVMLFRDVSLGLSESMLRFRLIHFWEARNPYTKVLIGQELLLIDEEGTVIQGFIPAGRVGTFDLFPVADHIATVTFTWNTDLSVLENPPVLFPADRFRFHSHNEFRANCDSKGGLYDYVGHMRLVNGQILTDHTVLDEVDIAGKRHLFVHVQTHDGPVVELYLWDKVAAEFCQKFKSYGRTPRVLLVTTVNPKHLGGTLALTSMSSSRVFMDEDVQPSKDYFGWLSSNSDIANRVAADVVTKPETATLDEIFFYIKQQGFFLFTMHVAWFECTATIDDIVQSSSWYYISCGGCNSKAVKGPTSLICNNTKCERSEVTGVAQYLTKISVYDKSKQAVFVILGDAGKELTGKHAAELVANYYEANEGVGADIGVPVPQALLDTIGQTRKFIIKVSAHNLEGKTQSLTVTKILPPEVPSPATSDGVQATESEVSGPSRGSGVSAGKRAINTGDILASDAAKLIQLETLMESKKQSTQFIQPPRQVAVTTAQPATSISTQESSTSRVTNVDELTRVEIRSYNLIRIDKPEEDIDPDYMHYLRAIGAYDSVQPQLARGKGRGRMGRH